MTLFTAKCKQEYLVKKLLLPKETAIRLEALGLTEGSGIELMRRKFKGAAIVKIRGTRFALGKEICQGIELWGDNE